MIKWGFIGSRGISDIVAKDICNNKDFTIAGVYSRTKKHSENFAKKFKCKAYDTFEEMLNDKEIDAIYVATPHVYHYYYSKKALEYHKPVLCEKPLTLNYDSAKELFDLAKKNNTYFAEAMWTWFNPTAYKVKEWIDNNKIGKLNYFTGDFSIPSLYFSRKQRLYKSNLGGGSLYDIGVYPVCYAYRLFGYPKSISAEAKIKNGIDYSLKTTFKYDDNFECHITSSLVKPGLCNVVIHGREGKIKLPYMFHQARKATLKRRKDNKQILYLDKENINLYEREFLNASKEIENGLVESKYVSSKDSLEVMRIMEEIKNLIGLKYNKENK